MTTIAQTVWLPLPWTLQIFQMCQIVRIYVVDRFQLLIDCAVHSEPVVFAYYTDPNAHGPLRGEFDPVSLGRCHSLSPPHWRCLLYANRGTIQITMRTYRAIFSATADVFKWNGFDKFVDVSFRQQMSILICAGPWWRFCNLLNRGYRKACMTELKARTRTKYDEEKRDFMKFREGWKNNPDGCTLEDAGREGF